MANVPHQRGGRGDVVFADFFAFAIEEVSDGIAIMQFTGDVDVPIRIIYANAAIERLSGFSRDELLDPANPFLRAQPQNRARYEELFGEIRAGRSVRFEIELTGKDRATWAEIRWSPLRAKKGGDVTHYVAVLRDITQQRRLKLFQSILAETSDFIVSADATPPSRGGPKITYANPAFGALVGLESESVVGMPLTEFFGRSNDPVTLANVIARLERHQGLSYELQLRQFARDTEPWIEIVGHQVRNESGRMASWFFIGKDISVRKQTYMQAAQLTTALDLADEPIAIYSIVGPLEIELQHANERAAEFDVPLLERMLRDPHGRERIASAWPALESGESAVRLVKIAGEHLRRWVTLELRPMSVTRGSVTSIIAIEHALSIAHDGRTQDIAEVLAISHEILRYADLEARRDAFIEVLRTEWGVDATFGRTYRDEDVVLRAKERGGYAVIPAGVLFDRPVSAHLSWQGAMPPRRLTALRILLETLVRAD